MARNIASPNIIIICFLIFFCTFSSSVRTPFDSSDINNVNVNDIDIDHNNHDASFPMSVKNPLDENSIFLPSENLPEPDSEPGTLIQYEPEERNRDHESKIDSPTTEAEKEQVKPLPLTVFRVGPIEHSHIHQRPSFRHPIHHRCHHAHNHYKLWNNHHLPHHTNDVVITKINEDVQGGEFHTVARGGAQRIPSDWMRYEEDINEMFSRERSKGMENTELLKKIYERYNQRRREYAEAERKDNNGPTFVKRIRKFLNGL
ncbi:hypothetical protein P8452_45466 [Trifolium repens]|nr:hypothetical protein P8452_45466 [Trifolium repens]